MLCLIFLSGAEMRRQEYDAAIANLQQVICLAEQAEWYGIAEAHRLLSETYLAQGRTGDALEPASQALTWAQAVEQPLFIGRAWLTLGRVAASLATPIRIGSSTHQAADCFANSEQQFREASARAQRGRALLVWAKYESELGDRQLGETLWQKGTRILTQLGISRPQSGEIRL
jgi:tetratricopeptide (TPR) repeat protein